MPFLDTFEVALRFDDLRSCAPSISLSPNVWDMLWSDYTKRSALFSEATESVKAELISYSLSFLHAPRSFSNALLAAVLFRLTDFCQWCIDFEQKLSARLDPQLFTHLIMSFEIQKNVSKTVLNYNRGDDAFQYILLTPKDNPLAHNFTTDCYIYSLDCLLSQLAHNITVDTPIFSSVCRTADRLTDVIINYKSMNTSLLEKALLLLAKLMMNPILFAFIITTETFDHGSIDRVYMEHYADDYYATVMDTTQSVSYMQSPINLETHKVFSSRKLLSLLISIVINHLPRVHSQKSIEFPLIYGCLLCIWMCSFIEKRLLLTQGIFILAVQILGSSILQNVAKIVRTVLKILLNVSTSPEAIEFMVASQLETTLIAMENKGWQESKENPSGCIYTLIRELHSILDQGIKKVTTWEAYLTELKSDMLGNTPVHTSEAFWKANAHRLLENSSYALNRLEKIGTQAYKVDTDSLLVCLNDIGMFCISYTNGRSVVAQMPKIKDLVMSCLQHESEVVRDAAIVTLSKLLVDNWRSV